MSTENKIFLSQSIARTASKIGVPKRESGKSGYLKRKKLPVFFTEARYFPGKRANHPRIQWVKKCL
jgi:hypothetical protein